MTTTSIRQRLESLGAVLAATPDGKLRVHVKRGLLTDDDRRAIGEHRDELLATLTPPPEAADSPPSFSRRHELRAAGDPHWQAPAPYRDWDREFVEAPCRPCKCKKTGAYRWAVGPDCAGCPERPQPKEARR